MASKNNKKHEIAVKWYYDANALDSGKGFYREIINSRPKETLISHLAIGEAYGNCLGKGKEEAMAFTELMDKIRGLFGKYNIKIIGNDDIEKQLDIVRGKIKRISITDAVHLATALKYKCCMFRTSDRDLYGQDTLLIKEVSDGCDCETISIKDMPSS